MENTSVVNRSDVLMAYQEKYGGYATNEDECGFNCIVDLAEINMGDHEIKVVLYDDKNEIIAEKDFRINVN